MRSPFFVTGFQRSGTTLLRLMLDSHPDVAVPLDTVGLWSRYYTELDRFNRLKTSDDVRDIVAAIIVEDRIQLWESNLTPEEVHKHVQGNRFPDVIAAFYAAYAQSKGKTSWGDKDPGNMVRLHLINRWFPNSKIVHLIRDGRDACLSLVKQDFGPNDLLRCAEHWSEQVWWVRCIGDILGPSRYYEMKYEVLVGNPEGELRRLCQFLELKYSREMLGYHRNVDQSIPISKRHIWPLINKPPQADNTKQWQRKMSKALRIAFEKRAGNVLQSLDYEVLPGPLSGAYVEELRSIGRGALSAAVRRMRRPDSTHEVDHRRMDGS